MKAAAIIVGCSHYDDDDIADLQFAHQDASKLANVLADICGVPQEDIYTLASAPTECRGEPTRGELLKVLALGRRVAQRAEIDTLFFAFSGHGCHARDADTDYLVLKDTVYGALEDSALEYQTLVRYLRQWNAKHTIIFLDACRSFIEAGKGGNHAEITQINADVLCPDGMITFSSCSQGQRSYESEDLGQGVFTASVLRALSDIGRCATVYELDRFLVKDVPEIGRRYGKPLQIPYTRVEPLAAQAAILVRSEKLFAWKREAPIGQEIRPAAERPVVLQAWPGMIAVDFGTSTSIAAIIDASSNDVVLARRSDEGALIPSVVRFFPNLSYVIGQEAVRFRKIHPVDSIAHSKRDLGDRTPRNIYGRSIYPETAASLVIGSLKRTAELYTSSTVSSVLASYPVNFTTAQLNGLIEAYRLAGFERIRIMPEPCAAGLMVHQTRFADRNHFLVLVVDLGGGTLDVATIEVDGDGGDLLLQVLFVDGDRRLGGLDYDSALAGLIASKAEAMPAQDLDAEILMLEAERAKILLGANEAVPVMLGTHETQTGDLVDLTLTISRDEARTAFKVLDDRVLAIIERVAEQTQADHIDAVILAGQGSQVFTLGQLIKARFATTEVIDRYQDSAVARGMGTYLKVLKGSDNKLLLLNVMTKSYGVKCLKQKNDNFLVGSQNRLAFSREVNENMFPAYLVWHNDIALSQRFALCKFAPGDGEICIDVIESLPYDTEHIVVSRLVISALVDLRQGVGLLFDTDHEGSLVVNLLFLETDAIESFQINQTQMVPLGYELSGDGDANGDWRVSASEVRRLKLSAEHHAFIRSTCLRNT
jgi:molecular chaperone DnaK